MELASRNDAAWAPRRVLVATRTARSDCDTCRARKRALVRYLLGWASKDTRTRTGACATERSAIKEAP